MSKELENKTGIAKYVLCIFKDLTFDVYHAGVKCSVPSMVRNRIHHLRSWSQTLEILRYLKSSAKDHKQSVLLNQAKSLGNIHSDISEQKYSAAYLRRS